MRLKAGLFLAILLIPTALAAATVAEEAASATPVVAKAARVDLVTPDHARLLAEDAPSPRGRLRYAVVQPVRAVVGGNQATGGWWSESPDGRALWQLEVRSPGAESLEVAFQQVFLPEGATLTLVAMDAKQQRGPYTHADLTPDRAFHSPYLLGAGLRIELRVPKALQQYAALTLTGVSHAYRKLWDLEDAESKSLNCEIDVACAEGDAFRDPVRAVARYTFTSAGGGSACTGQLINNAAGDRRPYLLTADHCVDTPAEANSMVFYWNYQSATCRTPGSAASGTRLPLATAVPQTGGATVRANYDGTDVTLLELNTPVPAAANAFLDGWDRRAQLLPGAAVVHHPAGDEKRISLDLDAPLQQITSIQIDNIRYEPGNAIAATYDRGTTEGGSSGAALLSAQGRIIGQLGGGPPGNCAAGITDIYGWLAPSWEGGGSAATRLRDWLDPAGTGLATLDGISTCAAPQLALAGPASSAAGSAVTFSLQATGQGPFRVEWDANQDGLYERTQTGVATGTSIQVNYPVAANTGVAVRVTDANGCSGNAARALVVTGPQVVATAGNQFTQLCGNNNNVIDPGERWRLPVTLTNAPGAGAINNGYAVFAQRYPGAAAVSIGPDAFGYTGADDDTGCGYRFIDLEAQSAPLTLTAATGGFDPDDDGRSGTLTVSPFAFYDAQVDTLVMSTNGYLSTSGFETGADYDNACNLTVGRNDSVGGRFNVYFDDLIVGTQPGAGLRAAQFAQCPRPSDTTSASIACLVFQWSHMQRLVALNLPPQGDITFQAIVYPATGEIVYQYLEAANDLGANATIGIRDASAARGLEYSCKRPRVPDRRSVCLFRPNTTPVTPVDARLRVETAAVPLASLAPGQSTTVNLDFATLPDAACGADVSLRYVGALDQVGNSINRVDLLRTTVGGGGACTPANCAATLAPVSLADGTYYNPNRSGNGDAVFTIPAGSDRKVFFDGWFTGEPNFTPTWYIVQDELRGNQAVSPVQRSRQVSPAPTFALASSAVGFAEATLVSPTRYLMTWNLTDIGAGGQIEDRLYDVQPATSPNRTGAWYAPSQGGWGLVVDDHFLGGTIESVVAAFFYDPAGSPRWTLGGSGVLNSGPIDQAQFSIHCPYCPNYKDFFAIRQPAGSLTRGFTGVTTGVLSTDIQLAPPLQGTWLRNAIPIQMLSNPQPQ